MLQSDRQWGFPVSWMVPTLDFVAVAEGKRLRSSPGATIADVQIGVG